MNRLFVFRNFLPRKRFCVRQLNQRSVCPRKISRTILCCHKSRFTSVKNGFELTLLFGTRTMSDCSAANSSLLDNLRKSVKEQVCNLLWALKRESILRCLSWFREIFNCATQQHDQHRKAMPLFGNSNGSGISVWSRKPVFEYFHSSVVISYLFWSVSVLLSHKIELS